MPDAAGRTGEQDASRVQVHAAQASRAASRARPQEPNSATVAVKPCRKRLAADRPDLAGSEEPGRRAHRRAPRRSRPHRDLRCRTSSARARCRRRRARPRPGAASCAARDASDSAQVAVGGHGVADVEAHDLAGPHDRADGDRAGSRVRADHRPHEEVALHVVGLVGVDDDAEQDAARRLSICLLGLVVERAERLLQLLVGGPAGELDDDVALGRGDRQLGPDGRGALRDARHQIDAVEAHADRARRRRPRRRGTAPGRRRPGARTRPRRRAAARGQLREGVQDRIGRERERVGEQDRAGGAVEVGQSGDRALGIARRWNAVAVPAPSDAAQTADGGALLDLTPAAEDALRAAADERALEPGSSWIASSVASGAARCASGRRTRPPGRTRRRKGRVRGAGGLLARRVRVGQGGESRADPDGHRATIDLTPDAARRPRPAPVPAGRHRAVRPDRGRQDRRGDRARASACASGARIPSRSRPTRCRSTAGSRSSPAPRRPASAPGSSTVCSRRCRSPRRSAPGATRSSRTPRSTALLAAGRRADRRRRHRSLPARGARGARPAPAARPRHPGSARERAARGREPRRCTASCRARAPAAAARIAPADGDPGRPRAGAARRRPRRRPRGTPASCGRAETRHPTLLAALMMEREALYARIDARVDAMVAAGAAEEVARGRGGRTLRRPRARRSGFEQLLDGDVDAMKQATRRYARRQLTWLRKLPGVLTIDVTGRAAEDVARTCRSLYRHDEPDALREVAGPRQRLPHRRGAALAVRADRGARAPALRPPLGPGADGVLELSPPTQPGFVAAPADLQPGRVRGRAVGQRRARGDPLPAPPRLDRLRHVLDRDGRRGDPPDDHRPDAPAAWTWAGPRCSPRTFPPGDADGRGEVAG